MKNDYTLKQCTCKHHIGERTLPLSEFATRTPNSTYHDGIMNMCKKCLSFIRKQYRINNKDSIRTEQEQWRLTHTDYIEQYGKEYRNSIKGKEIRHQSYERNRNQKREYDKIRRQTIPGVREKYNASSAKYRASKIEATPKWYEKEQIDQLYLKSKQLTETTGIKYHIDHIVPLQGEFVCGLHCLDNLQILPALDNISKSNYFDV